MLLLALNNVRDLTSHLYISGLDNYNELDYRLWLENLYAGLDERYFKNMCDIE